MAEVTTAPAAAAREAVRYRITGMGCASCAAKMILVLCYDPIP